MISTPIAGSCNRVRLLFVSFLILLICGIARGADPFADDVRKTEPLNPDEERTKLHVPAGFEVQLVACEPEIGKPMNMALDAGGRLWITQSREYPYAAPLDKPGRDKIQVLSDFNENGRARKVTTFADCHSSPVYQLLRGAYYPSFGKPHDGLGFGPEICTHSHGSTAIAGMVYYAADRFPPEYRDNTFVGNVVTCRINRDSFEQHGSTRVAKEEQDFLRSDDPWFRPVDLQLGPDGALYVADFYNRIIGHYEVPLTHPGRDRERGRIWRIVYRGSSGKADKNADENSRAERVDISTATPQELIRELATANITRRMLAMNDLVDRIGPECVSAVKKMMGESGSTEFQKIHGLWILSRLGGLDEKTLTSAAGAKEPGVRVHAMRVLSESPAWSPEQQGLLLEGLKDPESYVQRAAADAAGRHPEADLARVTGFAGESEGRGFATSACCAHGIAGSVIVTGERQFFAGSCGERKRIAGDSRCSGRHSLSGSRPFSAGTRDEISGEAGHIAKLSAARRPLRAGSRDANIGSLYPNDFF